MEKLTSKQFIEFVNENGKFNSRVLHNYFGINYSNNAIYVRHSGTFTINSLKSFMGLKGVKHDDIILMIKNTRYEYRNNFRVITVNWLDKIEIEYRFHKYLAPSDKPTYYKNYPDNFIAKKDFDIYRKDPSCEIVAVYQTQENRTTLHDWTMDFKPKDFEFTRFRINNYTSYEKSYRCSKIEYPNNCNELTIYKEYLDKSGYDRHFNQSRMYSIVHERKENRRKQAIEKFDFTPFLNEQTERLNEVLNHVSKLVLFATSTKRLDAIESLFTVTWTKNNYYRLLRNHEFMIDSINEKSRSLSVQSFLKNHNELLTAIDNLTKEINEMIADYSN